jgi:hypothetical protein
MAAGICSECPTKLERPNQKTCSTACRSRRAHRLKAQQKRQGKAMGEANANPPHLNALATKDIVHELAKEELRPVVRESLTQEVLEGIGKLVGLTTLMVNAIEEDLNSGDKYLRQKAYSLLARYTLGNQSVAPAAAAVQPQAMQVIFQLPRPGDDGQAAVHVTAEEIKTCHECDTEKPVAAFVEDSERCQQCHDELQARVKELYGG